jgi:hypothetical protein
VRGYERRVPEDEKFVVGRDGEGVKRAVVFFFGADDADGRSVITRFGGDDSSSSGGGGLAGRIDQVGPMGHEK